MSWPDYGGAMSEVLAAAALLVAVAALAAGVLALRRTTPRADGSDLPTDVNPLRHLLNAML